MNARRPKDIGTAAESAVVAYLRENGWPHAERRALHGNVDLGDVTGTPGLVWEVKGGDAAKTASDRQVECWLAETDRERRNAHADHGILVTARHRKSVGDWWAHLYGEDFALMVDPGCNSEPFADALIRLHLSSMVGILRALHYGTEQVA